MKVSNCFPAIDMWRRFRDHIEITYPNGAELKYQKDHDDDEYRLERVKYSNGDTIILDIKGRVIEIEAPALKMIFLYEYRNGQRNLVRTKAFSRSC